MRKSILLLALCLLSWNDGLCQKQRTVKEFHSVLVSGANNSCIYNLTKKGGDVIVSVDNINSKPLLAKQKAKNPDIASRETTLHVDLNPTYRRIGNMIDSLNIINYKQDTVYIFEIYAGTNPFSPTTYVFTDKDFILFGYGPLKDVECENGWKFYYDDIHPILKQAIADWDIEMVKTIIFEYGTEPGQVSGPMWSSAKRVILNDYHIERVDIMNFDIISFYDLKVKTLTQ